MVGYLCTYLPEEVLYSAGVLPVRVMGGHEPQDVTEPHIAGYYCAWCRDTLAQGILGRYDYLDGLATAHSCMHIRQTYHSWIKHHPVSYSYYMYMPGQVHTPQAEECLRREIEDFKCSVEEWVDKDVSEDALKDAIQVYGRHRQLIGELYRRRKGAEPFFSGAEALSVVLSSQVMDKREHNQWLEELLSKPTSGAGASLRLMMLGSVIDDVAMVELIESMGAMVVTDDSCTGTRYFWGDTPLQTDPYTHMAKFQLRKPPCPIKDMEERRRPAHVLSLAQEYGVHGAIFVQEKFCDPHASDFPTLRVALEQVGIPSLKLEVDVTTPLGQLRTRIEAFMEMLQVEV
ncbi:MAG: 2-hydroxyacyl-CoA dehydratase [Dehalococcoidia bacterium]|nr:2-hydroxyacyl-CoA dehydratase [Dehalococcoidia bacterium]